MPSPGKPLVGDAARIAGLVLVHKKPVERLPRRAAVGSETQQIRHLILHREPEKLRVRAEIGNEHLRAGGLADGTAYAEGKQVRHHGRKETAHRIADKIRSPDDVGQDAAGWARKREKAHPKRLKATYQVWVR